MTDKIRLGISSCLLGESVRYDGSHQLDRFLRDELGSYVDYVPVCPEVECGMPIPREALRLVGDPVNPRLVTRRSGVDHSDKMEGWARKRVEQLTGEGLCGFIFKVGSPSSGMERVKVYNDKGMAIKQGVGIFPRIFMARFPLLPVEEDGRLHDAAIRENFIERIFTLRRWRELPERSRGSLVDFHTRHKLLIFAHSEQHARRMGRLVATAREHEIGELFAAYESQLLEALRLKATVRKNVNVLEHMLGYFRKMLSPDERRELKEVIESYHGGLVPLIVPLTLFQHHVRMHDVPYLKDQVYLQPHPLELRLRNHV